MFSPMLVALRRISEDMPVSIFNLLEEKPEGQVPVRRLHSVIFQILSEERGPRDRGLGRHRLCSSVFSVLETEPKAFRMGSAVFVPFIWGQGLVQASLELTLSLRFSCLSLLSSWDYILVANPGCSAGSLSFVRHSLG